MAATETKVEPPNDEAEEEHEQVPETLVSNKTVVVLRVSIHCQGCKKKVQKILQHVHGVENIEIDMRQHKVEVTGNVNGETLIKKLTKAGKHAELWPEKPDSKMKRQSKPENKEKQSETAESSENDKESVKVVAQDTSNNNNNNNNNVNKNSEGCATGKTGVKFQEPIKQDVRQTVVLPPPGPVTEKKVSIAVQVPNDNEVSVNDKQQTGGAGGSSSTVKKKKKKVNTGKAGNNDGASSSSTPTVTVKHHSDTPANGNGNSNGPPGNQSHGQGHVVHHYHVNGPGFEGSSSSSSSVPIFSRPSNESPPRHHPQIYRQYPPHYYAAPPQVVHNVSYLTAHPSSSYGASYYAAPQPYSYAHVVRPGNEIEHQPPYMYDPEPYTSSYTPSYAAPSYTTSYTPSQPSDSFELFSDENPNACSLM